ncbi:SCAN domain-containing protein 3-like [Oopsacas minuta]|uniref:SCAN domain-containing protein 3-like n=1 Tax=Oopsacas minuta TaxID=111878 RepID=A0AAV7JDP8_9METZ|nr:SCAN domain-containing protein 3-like [Oopsacas minuta]
MLAPYNISNLIAKDGKPYSIGETLILPAISEVISTVMNQNAAEILRSIPLSTDTVARRIDEMANDVKTQLIHIVQTTEFSLQLDESTLCDNEALLLGYARFTKTEQHQKSFYLPNH